MLARRLTDTGIAQFAAFLNELSQDPGLDAPAELLTESQSSAPLDVEVDAEPRAFHSRLEAAEHLFRILRGDPAALRNDPGFWTWLSLCWFDELCPVVRERRRPGHPARWIADLDNPRRTWRHLLAGPFQILRAHRDAPQRAMVLLSGPIHRPGPLTPLLASRPALVTCHAVVGAATRLYYNPVAARIHPGLNPKNPGSPRRFTDILSQLDLTWDLHSLSVEELLDLLPAEFDHFHRSSASESTLRQRSLLD